MRGVEEDTSSRYQIRERKDERDLILAIDISSSLKEEFDDLRMTSL